VIETEADALEEEAEVKRLQQKQLQGMTEADFGFDEAEWLAIGKDEGGETDDGVRGKVVREVLPKLEITDAMGREERSKLLRTRYPEFEPLAKELLDLQSMYDDLKTAATEAVSAQDDNLARANRNLDLEDQVTPIAFVKYSALTAYLAALSMYFGLLTAGQEGADGKLVLMPPEMLRDHTIMETLVQCRDLWHRVKDVIVPKIVPKVNSLENGEVEMSNGLDGHEISTDTPIDRDSESGGKPKKRKRSKSKAQKAAEKAQIEAEAQRAERIRKTEEELASLSVLMERTKQPSNPKMTSRITNEVQEESESDFGEQTTLTAHETAEKAKRKKSLRFYTSQIAQKSNKRDAAGRDAGGDADLPYQERLKDRQARLNAEAENRGKKPKQNSKGDALGGPSDEEDHATAKELRDRDGSGSEDYYDLVAAKAADKKAAKAALAAAHAQAEKEGGIVRVADDNTVGEDGKRAISYQIQANKARILRTLLPLLIPQVALRIASREHSILPILPDFFRYPFHSTDLKENAYLWKPCRGSHLSAKRMLGIRGTSFGAILPLAVNVWSHEYLMSMLTQKLCTESRRGTSMRAN